MPIVNQSSTSELIRSKNSGKYTIPAGPQLENRIGTLTLNAPGIVILLDQSRSAGASFGGARPRKCVRSRRLQPSDDRPAQTIEQPVPGAGVLNNLGAKERRAQNRGMRDFAAQPASHAAVVDVRDRVHLERVGCRLHGQRGTARKPDAGVASRAGVLVPADAGAHHALPRAEEPGEDRPDGALALQLALGFRAEHFQPRRG